jgi:tape measure domain-containing protein
MATDEERLLVRIEAQLRQFDRAMAKATGTADRSARSIERRFRTMETRLAATGAGLARTLLAPIAALVSAREIAQAADSFTRIQNALKVAGLAGEEAAAVFERLFSAAQKNAAPIESLVELYSRAALVQKELGVSSEELLRFTEGVSAALRVSGKSAAESSGALLQLSQALGSGVVRAEEFNSILEGALPIAQAVARGLEEAGGSVAKLRTLVIDGAVSSEAFFRAFEAGQGTLETMAETTDVTLGGAMTRLRNTLTAVVGGMDDTTGTTRLLVAGFDGIADVVESAGAAIDFFADKLDRLQSIADPSLWERFRRLAFDLDLGLSEGPVDEIATKINAAAEAAAGMREDIQLAEALRRKVAAAGGDLIAGPAAGAQKTVSLSDFAAPSKKGGGSGGSAGGSKRSAGDRFADDIRRIQERTEALRVEAQLLGETTIVRERALAVLDLENEAKQAGLTITPQLNAQIQAEAEAYAQAADAMEKAQEKQESLNELQQAFGQLGISSFQGLIDGSKTLNDVLDDTLKLLTDMALKSIFLGEGPLPNLFGGRGGGLSASTGSILAGRTAGGFGGLFASGGTLGAGKWGIAGENGPEVIHGPAGVTPMTGGHLKVVVNNNAGDVIGTSERRGAGGERELLVTVDKQVQESVGRMAGRKSGRAIGLRAPMVQR